MSDPDPDQELDTIYAGLGWRTYEEAFGDRAELARAAASRIGEHANRAHTRGDLLSPSLIDQLRGELGRQEVVAEERADGSTQLTTRRQLSGLVRCDEPPKVSVRFDVGADDAAASRIAALLGALGFETERVSLPSSLTWRIDELARRHHLSQVERRLLELIVADQNNAQIAAELGLTRATVKWHTHNLLGKTKAVGRSGLLAMLLGAAGIGEDRQLGEAESEPG